MDSPAQQQIDIFIELRTSLLPAPSQRAYLCRPNQVNVLSLVEYSLTAETISHNICKYYAATILTEYGYDYTGNAFERCVSCGKVHLEAFYIIGDPLGISLCRKCVRKAAKYYKRAAILDTGERMFSTYDNEYVSMYAIYQVADNKLIVYTMSVWDLGEIKNEYSFMYFESSECSLCNTESNGICNNCHKMMAKIYAGEFVTLWLHLRTICGDGNLRVPNDITNYIAEWIIKVILLLQ